MGHSGSRLRHPVDELEYVMEQERLARDRQASFPGVLGFVVPVLLIVSLCIYLFTNDPSNIAVVSPLLVAVLACVNAAVNRWWQNRAIQKLATRKQIEREKLETSVKASVEFIRKLDEKHQREKEIAREPVRSVARWICDRATGGYSYNPRALICKQCGRHNGLCDETRPVTYNCSGCKAVNHFEPQEK
jgi:ABC-type multidrug transport system fused ATPase/permease subunit